MSNLEELVSELYQLSNDVVEVKGDVATKKALLIKNLVALSGKGFKFRVTVAEGPDLGNYYGYLNHKEGETFTLERKGLYDIDFTLEGLLSVQLVIPFFALATWVNE